MSLDSAAKEMGGRSMTLNELEDMFKEEGIVTDNLSGRRIVGDNVTRFLYISGTLVFRIFSFLDFINYTNYCFDFR